MENLKEKIYTNTLYTCEYISGYENSKSILTLKCLIHNLLFKTSYQNINRSNRPHFVCPLCQVDNKNKKYIENRVQLECAYCGKTFTRPQSKLKAKSNLYFCCREHKDLAQKLVSGEKFNILRPEHYGQETVGTYRRIAYDNYEHKCAICGWNEDIEILETHHIDENRENNNKENLILLCPICHRKIFSRRYKLINREKIILIE